MLRRLFILFSLLIATIAWAATTPNSAISPQTVRLGRTQLVAATLYAINAGGTAVTNTQTLYTCGANGGMIKSILAAGNESVARDVTLFMIPASSKPYIITTVSIPITAGQISTAPPVDMLSATNTPGLPVDGAGNRFLSCESGDTFAVGARATMTGSTIFTFLATGADF